jgi:regulation of enolase protein 1 (concanavalin A-like superfamily)
MVKITKKDMRWANEPEKWKQKDEQIKVTCPSEVDYWRGTLHGFIKDDAPFYWMYADHDFEARLSIKGKFKGLYDQAGLMIRLDEENWIKVGICMFRDQLHVSCVFTRGMSDWSTHRLPKGKKVEWFHVWVKRIEETIEVFYSLDNTNWIRIRQGHFVDAPRLRVGMMCAAPESGGYKVTFQDFMIKAAVDDEDFVDEGALENPAESLLLEAAPAKSLLLDAAPAKSLLLEAAPAEISREVVEVEDVDEDVDGESMD